MAVVPTEPQARRTAQRVETITALDGNMGGTCIYVNDGPVWEAVTITNAVQGVLYSYTVLANDVDVGDTLTYSEILTPG